MLIYVYICICLYCMWQHTRARKKNVRPTEPDWFPTTARWRGGSCEGGGRGPRFVRRQETLAPVNNPIKMDRKCIPWSVWPMRYRSALSLSSSLLLQLYRRHDYICRREYATVSNDVTSNRSTSVSASWDPLSIILHCLYAAIRSVTLTWLSKEF